MLSILTSLISVGALSAPFLPQIMSSAQRQTALTLLPMADAALRGQAYRGQIWSKICQKKTERSGFVKNNLTAYKSFQSSLLSQGMVFKKEKRSDILVAAELEDVGGRRWIMAWLPGVSENDAVIVLCKHK